jgi:hypothetical protein
MEFIKSPVFALSLLSAALLAHDLVQAYPEDLDLQTVTDVKPAEKIEAKADGQPLEKKQEQITEEQVKQADEARKKEDLAQAKAEEKARQDAAKKAAEEFDSKLCSSTNEYIATLKFLRTTQVILVTENAARMIADRVSKACDGAADRFAKILKMFKSVGLSDRKAMELALDFAARPTEVQKNFIAIFTSAYLAEFLDYDYAPAVALAYELSKDYKGDPVQVREDFIELMHFCKDGQKLDLPIKLCSEYTIKMARLSQNFKDGVRASFYKLFQRLRDDRTFAMDIKSALELPYNILRTGPRGPDNFFTGYDFAMLEKDGLGMTHAEAIEVGLRMAHRSYLGSEPPYLPNPSDLPVVVRRAASVY